MKLDQQIFINFNSNLTSPKTIIGIPTKAYVDSLCQNNRSKPPLSTVFKDQENDLDNNKLTNLDGFTVKRLPTSDNELQKLVLDSKGERSNLRFYQTLQSILHFQLEMMLKFLRSMRQKRSYR